MNRLTVLFPALAIAFAQNPAPQSGPATGAAPNTVIRIDVNLVQVDAVVTDSRGRRVTDLQSPAFEILQDGKPQAIANFSYVSTKPGGAGAAPAHRVAQAKLVKGETPPPPCRGTACRAPTSDEHVFTIMPSEDAGISPDYFHNREIRCADCCCRDVR